MRKEKVEDYLRIKRPISGIVEDKNGVNFEGLGGVGTIYWCRQRTGRGMVVVGEDLIEGPDLGIGHQNIAWCDDVLEAISRRC